MINKHLNHEVLLLFLSKKEEIPSGKEMITPPGEISTIGLPQ